VLIWTAAVFALWHLPVALLEKNFTLPPRVIPVYVANAFLIGLGWGIIRRASGSVLTAALSHGVWNALAYVLFGYGAKAGVLEVSAYTTFGPERGVVGIVLNAAAVVLLWRWLKREAP
jgi:membrane protease YdiL (CAAX protease family)